MMDRPTFLEEYYFRLVCIYAFDLCDLLNNKKTSQILQVKSLSGPFQYITISKYTVIHSDHASLHIFKYPNYNTTKRSQ